MGDMHFPKGQTVTEDGRPFPCKGEDLEKVTQEQTFS